MGRLSFREYEPALLVLLLSAILSLGGTPTYAQSPSSQLDSTVTVSPEGDTIVTYQMRKTDFGRDAICCYAEKETVTA